MGMTGIDKSIVF